MNDQPMNAAITDLERDLASLCPRPSRLDRDRLMFQAGWEARKAEVSVPWRRWLWPAATVAASVAAVVLGIMLVTRPINVVREVIHATPGESHLTATLTQSVKDDAPGQPEGSQRLASSPSRPAAGLSVVEGGSGQGIPQANYLHTRQLALVLGLDALPAWSARGCVSAPPLKPADVLFELGIQQSRIQ